MLGVEGVLSKVPHQFIHEGFDSDTGLSHGACRLSSDPAHLASQHLHIVQSIFLVEEVDDFDVIVDLFDGGIWIVHEIIGPVDILTAEGIFDCLHFQDDGVAEVFLAFLEQFCDFVPLSNHFLNFFLEEDVVLMTMFSVTIDAETVERSDQLINTAHPMSSVFLHHTLLTAFAIQGTCIVETDVLDGLMTMFFGLVAEVLCGFTWLLRTFSSECGIVEHGFDWVRWLMSGRMW